MQLVGGDLIGLRRDLDVQCPLLGQLVQARPDALTQSGQIGGSQSRGLLYPGAGYGDPYLVGLELQEQIHDRGTTVDPELVDGVP